MRNRPETFAGHAADSDHIQNQSCCGFSRLFSSKIFKNKDINSNGDPDQFVKFHVDADLGHAVYRPAKRDTTQCGDPEATQDKDSPVNFLTFSPLENKDAPPIASGPLDPPPTHSNHAWSGAVPFQVAIVSTTVSSPIKHFPYTLIMFHYNSAINNGLSSCVVERP
jgi:hypothetical protein